MPPHGPRHFSRPTETWGTLIRLLHELGRYRVMLGIAALGIAASVGANVYGTWLIKPFISECVVPLINNPQPDFTKFNHTLVLLGSVYLLGVLGNLIHRQIMVRVASNFMFDLRCQLFERLQRLPVAYHDTHKHGESMSLFTNDIDTMRDMLGSSISEIIGSAIRLVSIFVLMIMLSPMLTGLTVIMMLVMMGLAKILGSRSAIYFRERQESLGKLNGYIEELVEGQNVVKAFNYEKRSQQQFAVLNEEMRLADTGANTFASIIFPVMGNLSHVSFAITAIAGGLAAIYQGLDLGSIAAFLQCSRIFSMPITMISQQLNAIINALAGAERVYKAIDQAPEVDEGLYKLVNVCSDRPGSLQLSDHPTGCWAWQRGDELIPVKGDVRFKKVNFSYDGVTPVLKDFGLYAKPGQKIAFVGSTGAGKTTITNLLNRFYEIDSGQITYDGLDLRTIAKADLRRSLAMVLQDTNLFTGSVADNIRWGRPEATQAEVEAAARAANAHGFISRLPQGYETPIAANGENLSQGQRQLLAIARAACINPPVLVLDEATSSVDVHTEALISKAMNRLMEGRTVFVIAHRLSTVRSSDAIMVLEHGVIIERGNHAELMAQQGRYYSLCTGKSQLE